MKLHIALLLVCLFGTSLSLPVQIGIFASNSNEILRLNGLTLATLGQIQMQASSILPQYVLQQQQPDVVLSPQMVHLNPKVTGPFGPQLLFPTQGNQLTHLLVPNGQQEQAGPPQDPNVPVVPQQPLNPMQMVPQYQYPAYGYPQQPGMPGYPYYLAPYGYPQQRNALMFQPNNGQVGPVQQSLEKTTQKPQLSLQQASKSKVQADETRPVGTHKEPTAPPPSYRGDAAGPGIDEYFNIGLVQQAAEVLQNWRTEDSLAATATMDLARENK
ncbi:uncharacterized protein odam [Lampris incognitus]|uniref:uncharacterized protein odam n=1 Tax=Lampris incognitus TaxID=2546036 RepID=UPI0024B590BC|nr:uncharacterized protein odam [Lampris incognitus]